MTFVVIGAGGLGCPALLGLVAAGAQRLCVIDDDLVEASNLPRQVLYGPSDVGRAKVDAARSSLLARAPAGADLQIETRRQRLAPGDLAGLIGLSATTIVLECSDSPGLKFAVHDACVRARVPVVIGGVVRWHGQAMAIDLRQPETACYRCVFEEPPPPELAPACASVGVAGPAAGSIGHAMASLALGLASAAAPGSRGSAGPGERPASGPAGTLLHLDLLRGALRQLAPKPRPSCPICAPLREPRCPDRNVDPRPT